MSMTPTWDDQRVFLAVLEEGSLAGAARALGLSHPTVRARIAALEAALGTTLFTRAANGLTPTPRALELRPAAEAMAAASARFVREAAADAREIAGVVRLGASDFVAAEVLPPVLAALRLRHPGLRFELAVSNRIADVTRREVDVAIRNTAPQQGALVARRLPSAPLGFFAARAYVARRGIPETLESLLDHDLIGPDRDLADLGLAASRFPAFDPARFALRTDDHAAAAAAIRAGIGIGATQVPAAARDPDLVRVLPQVEIATLDYWLVTHADLRAAPRIRATMDGLAEGFTAAL